MANFANVDRFGDPSSPDWQSQNLVTVTAPNGQRWTVYKEAAPAFSAFLQELTAAGYDPISSGGFNYRNIRGGNMLSQHAFGAAIDINAQANPMGGTASDLPAGVGEMAAKYGLEWGGNWQSRPDPMHFELTGSGFSDAPHSHGGQMAGLAPQQGNALAPPQQNALAAPQRPMPQLGLFDMNSLPRNRLRV